MKNLCLLLVLLSLQYVEAQNYNFGKVSKEELSEQFYSKDSTAVAAYLFKSRRTYFRYDQTKGFELVTDIHERIKIYNKDGFDYATRKINLYKDRSNYERINGLKAVTYNLEGNKIAESKLKSDGEFEVELSAYYDQKSFTMPNVKEGSVIEYRYKLTSPFIAVVDDFQLQHDIPIKYVFAEFEVPEYLKYNSNAKGYLSVIPKVEAGNGSITISSKSRTGGGLYNAGTVKVKSSNINYKTEKTVYELKDVPALKSEPYVNNINNYRSSVKYELAYTKYPNSLVKEYSTDWEAVVKTIYESPNFGSELNRTGYYQKSLEDLLQDVNDPAEKVAKIYNFVKSHVKWDGYTGKYTSGGVRKAYKDNVGNVAEINLMLTSMLRSAGLDANPVLVSTRSNGVPLFPTREGYNYVIAGVEMSGNMTLLDATSNYSTPNVLPLRALNWEGRMIKKDGSSQLVNLYPKNKTVEAITLDVDVMEDGELKGNIRKIKTGHHAMFYRSEFNAEKEEGYIEGLENKYGGIEISEFEVSNESNLSKPVSESYGFRKEGEVEIIGDRIIFSPMFFLSTKESPFKLEKREFPVDFGFPSETKYRIAINIPEGYIIETLPEPQRIQLPEKMGDFTFNVLSSENRIQLVINSKIYEAIISPLYYDAVKEYYKIMIGKMNEKVVLSKISK